MSEPIDRRAFLGGAAAVGAIAAAAGSALTARAVALVPALPPQPGADDDWHIDDMWGHTPRYAHPIPYAAVQSAPIAWEHVDPIDRFLVI